jgi:hypothetical protein
MGIQYLFPLFFCSGLTSGGRISTLFTPRAPFFGKTRQKDLIGFSFLTSGGHFESTLYSVIDEEGELENVVD